MGRERRCDVGAPLLKGVGWLECGGFYTGGVEGEGREGGGPSGYVGLLLKNFGKTTLGKRRACYAGRGGVTHGGF